MPDLIDLGAHLHEVQLEEIKNIGPEPHNDVLKGAYESLEDYNKLKLAEQKCKRVAIILKLSQTYEFWQLEILKINDKYLAHGKNMVHLTVKMDILS